MLIPRRHQILALLLSVADRPHELKVALGDEIRHGARLTGTRGAPAAMDVVGGALGEIELDHVAHLWGRGEGEGAVVSTCMRARWTSV